MMLSNYLDSGPTQVEKRCLAVFDFDHTIVNDNTDTVVRDLLDPKLLTKSLQGRGWTDYMAQIFRLLHANAFTSHQICRAIRNIPEVPGLRLLLKTMVKSHNIKVIIISDSNSVFISEWLKVHGLSEMVADILTNPAQFDENGLLNIRAFSKQTKCKLCPQNLCKGDALECYLLQQKLRSCEYDRVIYIGDGSNDICPVLALNESGIVCARNGYAMQKKITEDKDSLNIKAKKIIYWNDGTDLGKTLMEELRRETKK